MVFDEKNLTHHTVEIRLSSVNVVIVNADLIFKAFHSNRAICLNRPLCITSFCVNDIMVTVCLRDIALSSGSRAQ